MKKRRTRVLVFAPDKARAEVMTRGLSAMERPRFEMDVTLEPDLAGRQLADCAYDVLLIGLETPTEVPDFARSAPGELPIVIVGGAPGEVKSNGVHRVPLPLSYTLLEQAVLRALELPGLRSDADRARRRDQAG